MISAYFSRIREILDEILETQSDKIRKASEIVANAVERHGNIYAFGCNHANIIAQELVYRTGGLAVINPMPAPGLMLDARPMTMTTGLERLEGYGQILVDETGFKPGDVLVIHSVSGRNGVPVEVADRARKAGASVICITNVKYSESVSSRHSSGKRLLDVSDLVIDNCGDVGDAAIHIEGMPEKVASSSTVAGAAILNAMVAEAVSLLVSRGIAPPVFISSNVEGGDSHNERILREYKENIKYM